MTEWWVPLVCLYIGLILGTVLGAEAERRECKERERRERAFEEELRRLR